MKRTKIVATIGPSSESKSMMEKLISAGMNVGRLNFSHGSYANHQILIGNLREAAKKMQVSIAILQDLQGPRIRIGTLPAEGVEVKHNDTVILVLENYKTASASKDIYIPIQYLTLYKEVEIGHPILIDDANIELEVIKIKDKNIYCKVVTSGTIKTHKGMNFPKSTISCPPITAKDWKDLDFGVKNGLDYVALSFVKDASDIIKLRKKILLLETKYHSNKVATNYQLEKPIARGKIGGVHMRIIAKIERREAVENIDEILEVADGIMVARGDLGIELPFEELPLIQKNIIDKCRKAGKQVIVATQMLDSMIRNPLPTRAEVSDVANAILDGTDAIMLSGETASGKYPIKAVQAMTKIAHKVEVRLIEEQEAKAGEFKNLNSITQIMSFVAQDLAEDISHAKLIVCATTSGFTARNISRFRSGIPVIAVAPSIMTVNQMSLSWGVSAYYIPFTSSFDVLLKKIKKIALDNKLAESGDTIVLVAGHPFGFKGQTNFIKVEVI